MGLIVNHSQMFLSLHLEAKEDGKGRWSLKEGNEEESQVYFQNSKDCGRIYKERKKSTRLLTQGPWPLLTALCFTLPSFAVTGSSTEAQPFLIFFCADLHLRYCTHHCRYPLPSCFILSISFSFFLKLVKECWRSWGQIMDYGNDTIWFSTPNKWDFIVLSKSCGNGCEMQYDIMLNFN